MSEFKPSSMERRTLNAVDSANPFQTPVRPHMVKGRQVQKKTPEPKPSPVNEIAEDADHLANEVIENVPENVPENVSQNVQALGDVKPLMESEFENPVFQSHDKNGMPSYRLEFAGRDVFVGLPWYKTSNPVTTMALVAMALDFGKDRIRFDLVMGDPGIHNARSTIVEKFLQTDAKWLLMLDDDIIPSIGRAEWFRSWVPSAATVPTTALQRHVLHRLIGAGKTLVGAAYWGRQENGRLMCSDRTLENDARTMTDRVVPVDWIGTGCLLAHRKVFEDIQKSYPELQSKTPAIPFDYFLPSGKGMSEDVSFCARAKKAGHQPHIDLGIPVKHLGYKTY
jgi:hypothetical protein